MNKYITKFERNLIRTAVRRVFSRSELRKKVMERTEIPHSDPKRPRVTRWIICKACQQPTPRYEAQCDHINPVRAVNELEEDLAFDVFLNRVFCEPGNLQPICKPCHKIKSQQENSERRKNKKARKIS